MLNQRKLYVSMMISFMMIAVITIVAADDVNETTVQNPGISLANVEEENCQNAVPKTEDAVKDEIQKEDAKTEEPEKEVEETEVPELLQEEPVTTGQKESVIEKEPVQTLDTESIWCEAYMELMYGELTMEKLAAQAIAKMKNEELALMSSETDHIVNYHGTRYAITDEEYQVLLHIVEAEAPEEDVVGRMLVANVVLNRVHAEQFPNTITEVVFQKDQFSPVADGMYFKRTPSELTIEAVERVLAGEDESQGALYFVARKLTTKQAMKFFDEKLVFLFKHGVHEFFTEK